VYRAERPGGCRHQQALRQAIASLAQHDDEILDAAADDDDEQIDLNERWTIAA
jgi:hypothetical protein